MAVTEQAPGALREAGEFLSAHAIRTVRVEWCDLHGVARGKRVQADYFLDGSERGFPFSSAAIEMDLRGEIPWLGDQHLPWPNLYAVPDLATLRLLPFDPHTAAVICDLVDDSGTPVPISPRQVLRRVLGEAASRGYAYTVGAEQEFYLFADEQLSLLPPGKLAYRVLNGAREQGLMDALFQNLCGVSVACESLHAEDGPGQFEVVLRYGPALQVADSLFVTRTAIREIASHLDLTATFLPKPLPDESGSGFHIHQSLRRVETGEPLFRLEEKARWSALEGFLAGQVLHTPELSAVLLPTVNAYKRAVTRRVRMNWGMDDRSASFRILRRAGEQTLEHRVPGADANPYLFIAAALGTGLEGVLNELSVGPVEGGAPSEGDSPAARTLPPDLGSALDLLTASAVARRWLGDTLIDRFVALKRGEADRYARTITDWERREYLGYL